ncbi:uncharacterized protein YbjT (DUF2867 family) [Nakamurella sp. UYEF19]|uniref:SDR family oxidoreductase n=1 Tax=Nakamurella sp. UYEF19 TaxID=1756392 RepID=UPI003391FE76
MSTVLVTGGTGNLGRHVVSALQAAGHTARVASRSPRPAGRLESEPGWSTVDYRSRSGLDDALAGVDVVVHCASGSARGEAETMAGLLSSGKRAGLRHLVYISIVGIDHLPTSYYRAKLTAERALIASGVGWTILRATQFHDLALTLVKGMCKLPIGVVPRRVNCQSVAVEEVATRLSELAAGAPAGRVPELGGPEIRSMHELARLYLASTGHRKTVLPVPMPGRLAGALRAGHQLTPDHGDGMQTFAEFLRLGPAY